MLYCSFRFVDVGETINETVEHVKEAVAGAVSSVGNAVGINKDDSPAKPSDAEEPQEAPPSSLTDSPPLYKHIPLKEAGGQIEEMTSGVAKSFKDDSDKIADDLIKETDHIFSEAGNSVKTESADILQSMKDELAAIETPIHSIADSLKTNTPEPEIVKALANDENGSKSNPESPKPTISEMHMMAKEL